MHILVLIYALFEKDPLYFGMTKFNLIKRNCTLVAGQTISSM